MLNKIFLIGNLYTQISVSFFLMFQINRWQYIWNHVLYHTRKKVNLRWWHIGIGFVVNLLFVAQKVSILKLAVDRLFKKGRTVLLNVKSGKCSFLINSSCVILLNTRSNLLDNITGKGNVMVFGYDRININ